MALKKVFFLKKLIIFFLLNNKVTHAPGNTFQELRRIEGEKYK